MFISYLNLVKNYRVLIGWNYSYPFAPFTNYLHNQKILFLSRFITATLVVHV